MPNKPAGEAKLIVNCELPQVRGDFDATVTAAQQTAHQLADIREVAAKYDLKPECGRTRGVELQIQADTVPAIQAALTKTIPVMDLRGAARFDSRTGQPATTQDKEALNAAMYGAKAEFNDYAAQAGLQDDLSRATGGVPLNVTITRPKRTR